MMDPGWDTTPKFDLHAVLRKIQPGSGSVSAKFTTKKVFLILDCGSFLEVICPDPHFADPYPWYQFNYGFIALSLPCGRVP